MRVLFLQALHFAFWLAASSLAATAAVRKLPWSPASVMIGLPTAVGIAAAPFLLALSAVLALGLMPGYSRSSHAIFILFVLAACGAIAGPANLMATLGDLWRTLKGSLLARLLLIIAVAVGAIASHTPLVANDPLEYAIVGRILKESSSLYSYPALDPEANVAGFYGPWTHPPLFVALQYFAFIIQEENAANITKLISPWFAFSAAFLVGTMGRLRTDATGFAAAVLFITTPLLLSGAFAAHIDPVPVSGFALALSVIMGISIGPVAAGAIQGVAVGIAMWSHSQAVLCLPVMLSAVLLYEGWRDKRRVALQCAVLTLTAVLVAAWPYARNYVLFGSLISDRPAVYALESLAWDDYFRIARGYDHWADRVKFGILKVWNSDQFGVVYWLMALGIAMFVARARSSVAWPSLRHGDVRNIPDRWLLAPLGAVVCYFLGVALSTMIGLDLMVRNDRYQLITLAAASLLGGYAVVRAAERIFASLQRGRIWGRSLSAAMLFGALCTVGITALKVPDQVSLIGQTFKSNLAVSSNRWQFAQNVQSYVPEGEAILSLRPADMYYVNRRMMSYLDPRLTEFYNEQDEQRAFDLLKTLKINYVYMPNYSLPPYYNSPLQKILSDRSMSRIVIATPTTRLYQLQRSPNVRLEPPIQFGGLGHCWTIAKNSGRGAGSVKCKTNLSVLKPKSYFNQRTNSATLVSGSGDDLTQLRATEGLPISSGEEYRLEIKLQGRAYAEIAVHYFGSNGRRMSTEVLGNTLVGDSGQSALFRFVGPTGATAVRVSVTHKGRSRLLVEAATLARFDIAHN